LTIVESGQVRICLQ